MQGVEVKVGLMCAPGRQAGEEGQGLVWLTFFLLWILRRTSTMIRKEVKRIRVMTRAGAEERWRTEWRGSGAGWTTRRRGREEV